MFILKPTKNKEPASYKSLYIKKKTLDKLKDSKNK